MSYFLVSLHGEDITKIDREPEEWEVQYMVIFSSELDAYKHAHKEQAEHLVEQERLSESVITQWRHKAFELLFQFDKEKLKRYPDYYGNEIFKITKGEIALTAQSKEVVLSET